MAHTIIPLMACRRQYEELREGHEAAIQRVTQSGWYLEGQETGLFEATFAKFCGVRNAVAVGNGTDALELALRAVGCRPGDEVIMAPNAGMYACSAVMLNGATPVFADVTPDTLLISATSIARMLTDRTAAVVATHLFGRLCDVAAIRKILEDRSIRLIEDCAQAHGAIGSAGLAGSYGDVATFSLSFPSSAWERISPKLCFDSVAADRVLAVGRTGKQSFPDRRPEAGASGRGGDNTAAIMDLAIGPYAGKKTGETALFGFRWYSELDICSIKAAINLGHVRCKSPEMVNREVWATLLADNLIRATIAGAAVLHDRQPRQISFTSAFSYIRRCRNQRLGTTSSRLQHRAVTTLV